jgi:hypothetical protein
MLKYARIGGRGLTLAAALFFSSSLFAQYGFPLVGSWSGYWGPDPDHQTRVLMSIDFSVDQVISGFIIEKGVRVPLTSASLDPSTWTVTMTGQRKDPKTGESVDYHIQGVIENLGSGTERAIAGTWSEDKVSGKFRVEIN